VGLRGLRLSASRHGQKEQADEQGRSSERHAGRSMYATAA
jgi:uncharacterized membrane-anchored protein